jgi:hypothetical protein
MRVEGLPTHFGPVSFAYAPEAGGGILTVAGPADPPGGIEVRAPAGVRVEVSR